MHRRHYACSSAHRSILYNMLYARSCMLDAIKKLIWVYCMVMIAGSRPIYISYSRCNMIYRPTCYACMHRL